MMVADGIRFEVTDFGPFTMLPEQAWRQIKAAMREAAKAYGINAIIVERNPEQAEEKFRAYRAWLMESPKP